MQGDKLLKKSMKVAVGNSFDTSEGPFPISLNMLIQSSVGRTEDNELPFDACDLLQH